MQTAEIDTRLRTWGNSYGIIIPADVARRLGLRPGEPVHVTLSYERARNDVSTLPKWPFRTDYDIDRIMDEETGA